MVPQVGCDMAATQLVQFSELMFSETVGLVENKLQKGSTSLLLRHMKVNIFQKGFLQKKTHLDFLNYVDIQMPLLTCDMRLIS